MKYFLICFWITLRERLSSFRNWIVLLLLPILVLSANIMLPEHHQDAVVSVGVVLPESCGEEMWQLLQGQSNDVISFILTDENTLDRNIAAGQWDCGIILTEDFDQRILDLDTDRMFTLRIGPGSAVYPLVKETVSACVAQLFSPHIAQDYLAETPIADTSSQLQFTDPDRVLVTMSTLDHEPILIPELVTGGTRDFLRWLICVSILVRMLFGAADLGTWILSSGMKRTQPFRPPLLSMTARGTADALLLFFSASFAMLLLGDGIQSVSAVLGYIAFWMMISLLLAQLPNVTTILHVLVPFGVVISLFLSSVLLDISLIIPQLADISPWLPVTMFLKICKGNPGNLIYLFLGSFLFLVLAWFVSLRRKKE